MIVKSVCRISAAEQLPAEHPVRKEKPTRGMDIYRNRTIDESLAESGGNIQVQMDEKKFEVAVPKGIQNGQKIRCEGLGVPGKNGGENGDLYIQIQIRREKPKRGKDFQGSIEITDKQSREGCTVQYKNMPPKVIDVKILKGTKEGEEIKLEGQGYPGENDGDAGDMYLKVHIKPEEIKEEKTEEEKQGEEKQEEGKKKERGLTLFGVVWVIGCLMYVPTQGKELAPADIYGIPGWAVYGILMVLLGCVKTKGWQAVLHGLLAIAVWFINTIIVSFALSQFITVEVLSMILGGIAAFCILVYSYKCY